MAKKKTTRDSAVAETAKAAGDSAVAEKATTGD